MRISAMLISLGLSCCAAFSASELLAREDHGDLSAAAWTLTLGTQAHPSPRTRQSQADGPAPGAQLKVVYESDWRIMEASIPWSEVPEANARLAASQTVKFDDRVNDDQGVGCMQLSEHRSVAKCGNAFMVDRVEDWTHEREFGAEPKAESTTAQPGKAP